MNKTASSARLKRSLEELARFGCPVDLSVADPAIENEKVEIEQVGGILESRLFELEDGRAACMAVIAVTNQTSRTIDLIDVELRATWDNTLFQWLAPLQIRSEDRAKRGGSYAIYQFPSDSGLQLEYSEVINHLLVERKKLPGARRLEGWLLGLGGPMPPGPRYGQCLDMSLTVIGSDHAEYSTTIHLWTERLQTRTKTRTPIFAKLAEEAIVAPDASPTAPDAKLPCVEQNLGAKEE